MQLIIESKCFIDPHGEVDFGGSRAFVTQADFSDWHDQYVSGNDIIEEDDLQGSEDGYNSQCEHYDVREISISEAIEAARTIESYEKLIGEKPHPKSISLKKIRIKKCIIQNIFMVGMVKDRRNTFLSQILTLKG